MFRLLLVAAAALPCLHAYKFYQENIPNGANVVDGDNNPVGGVGHLNVNGAGTKNQFGLDFQAKGKNLRPGFIPYTWTKALCQWDSDGDGLSNGVELGDPKCVWVKGGLAPQFDTGISHPGQKNGEEVSRARDSCEKYAAPTAAAVAAHDAASVNLTFTPPYNVPTKRTTYTKFAFNMFDIAKTAGLDQGTAAKTLFGTRFGVVNKHENVVHHMILYACDKKPSDAVVSAPAETGKMACTLLKYAWAVGGGDFCLPDGVGIEFDVSSRDKAWHVLEIHYDNPNAMSTIRDTSGVHITLVKKKLIPAGFMWVGSSLKALSVPPGKKVHHVEVTCRYPQIPTAGVNAFAFINHAHLLGRKLYTSLTRKGKYIHDLGCDTAYDFDLQQILPLEKEVKLYKTDTLKANCVYDSTERTATTQGGDETENEMCINFIAYYPEVKTKALKCLSQKPKVIPAAIAGIHTCFSGANCTPGEECKPPPGPSMPKIPTWLLVHILFMVLGWLVVLPAGIFVAALMREKLKAKGMWFKMHRGLMSAGLVIATVGVAMAMANIPSHGDTAHKIVGLVVMVFAWLQPLNALVRGHPEEPKPTKRIVWEYVHKMSGRIMLILALVNVCLGSIAMNEVYGIDKQGVFVVLFILFALLFALLFILQIVRKYRGNKAQTNIEKQVTDMEMASGKQ